MNVNLGAFENHFGASALKRDYFDLASGESIVMVFSNVELSSLAKPFVRIDDGKYQTFIRQVDSRVE
ncbi:hypothetical protein [Shewanella algidipiscicola]|uniref:Uncharacterized protein n=1 Tax=Shewanella algidipiscicola TaxID=614070 RepID=A0ABQ4NSR7_9GAMM|nr:hypothetical protein [Shewanella algidipiscicola]GIU01973.1 hypothetical protein TUM4630_31990 [Shewanella algidipiscicola]